MKKYNILFIVAILMAAFFTGCEDVDKVTYDPALVVSAAIDAPAASDGLTFTIDDADEIVDFSWSETEVGIDVVVSYDLQLSNDPSFENFVSLAETEETQVSVSVGTINSALITLEYEIDLPSTVYCRVLTAVNEYVDAIASDIVSYDVIAYDAVVVYPMIYVPGQYQGWNPGGENGRLYSYDSDDVYEGIIHITGDDGNFKIAPEAGWDGAWGGTLTASEDGYTGTLDVEGDNFNATPSVCYKFKVNVSDLTIEMIKTDYWGIIGAAIGGWGDTDDVILQYDGQSKMWMAKDVAFEAGSFKFRANNSWDLNFTGEGNIADRDDDGNIVMAAAGTYDVEVDPEAQTFTILPSEE